MNTNATKSGATSFYDEEGFSTAHSIKCVPNDQAGLDISSDGGEITIVLFKNLYVNNQSYWMVNITFKYDDHWSDSEWDVDYKECTVNTLIKDGNVQYIPVLTGMGGLSYICTVAVNCIGNAIWIKLYKNPKTPDSKTFDVSKIMVDATVYYRPE